MKNTVKRIFSAFFGIAMLTATVLAIAPFMTTTVYADVVSKTLGPWVLKEGYNTKNAKHVYMGKYQNVQPYIWRVIGWDREGVGDTANDDAATLLAHNYYEGVAVFQNTKVSNKNTYDNSFLRDELKEWIFNFTEAERSAIKDRILGECTHSLEVTENTENEYPHGKAVPYCDGITMAYESTQVKDKLWPLSTCEAVKLDNNIREVSDNSNGWWLRSPGSIDTKVADVDAKGTVWFNGQIVNVRYGKRPAFNLDLSSVIFTSQNEYGNCKLTLKDPKIITTVESGVTRDGNTITVPYSIAGDNKGNVNKKSILITDKEYDKEGAEIKLYEELEDAGDGKGKFDLLEGYSSSWKAYIIAEDINEKFYFSDYAGISGAFKIPDRVATPALDPAAGTFTETQNVTITCETDGATIYYTTNGSEPSEGNGKEYVGTISVDKTMTIKAIAIKEGMAVSEVAEAVYTKNPVCQSASIDAPSELVKGKSYDISCTFNFDKPITDENRQYISGNCSVGFSDDLHNQFSGEVYNNTDYTVTNTVDVPSDTAIKSITVTAGFNGKVKKEKTIPIVDPPIEYWTVSFDPNAKDAGGSMNPQHIEQGKTEKLNANKFTRKGFTFNGWNTKKDGSGTKYADKASITPKGNMTLYAQWKEVLNPVSIKNAKVVLKSSKIGYNGKNRTPVIKTIKGLKLKEGTDYSVSVQNSKGKAVKSYKALGKYTLVIKGKGNYTGSTKVGFEIVKGTNPLNVTAVKEKYSVPFSKIKKKDQTINKDKLFKFKKKGAGTITYSVSSAKNGKKNYKKGFSVNNKGNLVLKKGLKKGSYTVKVNVKAKGDKNYKAATKTVKFTVKVN